MIVFPESISYIVIEGNIGAGKTTLASLLAEKTGARLSLERFEENPYLEKFYENPRRHAFPLEMSFMADRYKQALSEKQGREHYPALTIADYYFTKSLIFAGITLPREEFIIYRDVFKILFNRLIKPDLYVYIHREVEYLMQNIRKRGRAYESRITLDYLKKIETAYFNYLRNQKSFKVVVVDAGKKDFNKELTLNNFLEKILLKYTDRGDFEIISIS